MNRRKLTSATVFMLFVLTSAVIAYADWSVFEETSIASRISGSIKKGSIFQTRSGNIYEVSEYVYLYEYEYNPRVVVLTDGSQYKLIIDGFEDPVVCRLLSGSSTGSAAGNDSQLSRPQLQGGSFESRIVNKFTGLDHGNVYRLSNGQIWQQTEYWKWIWIWVNPSVLVWQDGVTFKMKAENIDHAVVVERLR